MFGKSLMSEIVEQTINETTQKVLTDNNLRPAGEPDLRPEGDIQDVVEGRTDLAYEIALEVIPEFVPADFSEISLKRPIYEPTEEEVGEALAELAESSKTFEPRKGKTVKSKDGDQLLIDFVGRVDGEAFEGGGAEDATLTLGSGQFIPGFEEQLVGAKPGDEVLVKVTFPTEYQAAQLAGKDAEFTVQVKEVRAPKASKVDDALAERLGIENLEKLKELLRSNLQSQFAGATRFKLKRALLDILDERHDFLLPPRMVEAEFSQIWDQVQQDKTAGGLPPEDSDKSDAQLEVEYRKIAERRVRLGLVLAEVGRINNVQVTEQELAEAMRAEAMRYGPQAQQIFDFLRQNPSAQSQIRAPIFEEKVVDLIVSRAKVEDEKVSKEDLLREDDMPAAYKA
jgi:trigger factor